MFGGNHTSSQRVCPETGKVIKKSRSFWLFWLWPLLGLASLIWFLIRVVPKPSRASYPCQRLAMPLASTFVVWITGLIASAALFGKARSLMSKGKYMVGAFILIFAVSAVFWAASYDSAEGVADTPTWYEPLDAEGEPQPANWPIGVPRGIFPGRVVWAFDRDSANWDGYTNYWFYDQYNNQEVISQMMSDCLQDLTGAATDQDAWYRIFKHYNWNTNGMNAGYEVGEKIAIKLNMAGCKQTTPTTRAFVAPQMVYALIDQLVNKAGIPEDCILFEDFSQWIPACIYDKCHAVWPGVRWCDYSGGNGREVKVADTSAPIHFSQDLSLKPELGGSPLAINQAYVAEQLSEAEYFINFADLKGHSLAGHTIAAKNLFGSFVCGDTTAMPKNAGLHNWIAIHDRYISQGSSSNYYGIPMGTYSPFVDLMAHEELGGKTILYMVDALYCATIQGDVLEVTDKWQMEPFNGDWPSSLFMSFDGVAIDSVTLDFCRSEPTIQNRSEYPPQYGDSWDNYLHEAALAYDPPSGAPYDPETPFEDNDGVSHLPSLGVHEHWNNGVDKQYSGDFGVPDGIELVRSPMKSSSCDLDLDGDVGSADLAIMSTYYLFSSSYSDVNGLYPMEAESYSILVPGTGDAEGWSWQICEDTNASCGNYVMGLPDIRKRFYDDIAQDCPHMSYSVDIDSAGTYKVWIKGEMVVGGTYVGYGCDGQISGPTIQDAIELEQNDYIWTNELCNGGSAQVVFTEPGRHTFDIWMVDARARLDRILLTKNTSYDPTVNEPPVMVLSNPPEFTYDIDTNGLVAYWTMDEGANPAIAYDSAGDHNGSVINGSWTTVGKEDGALVFDATAGTYVSHDLGLPPMQGTICHWLMANQNTSRMIAYYECDGTPPMDFTYNGYGLYLADREVQTCIEIENDNTVAQWQFFFQDMDGDHFQSSVQGGVVEVGVWTHVAATYDRTGDAVLYVNGREVDRMAMNKFTMDVNNVVINDATWRAIGRPGQDTTTHNRYWDGKIDDVRIYDRVLSGDEIRLAFNQGLEKADVDGDGDINLKDFAEIADHFGDSSNP